MEKMRNTETNMLSIKTNPRVLKHFQTICLMPTQKTAYCHLPQSRGVIK